MKKQKSSAEEVPIEIVQSLVQEHIGDRHATITQFSVDCADELEQEGFGGGSLYRAKVFWEMGSHSDSANWVIKRWRPGGLVGTATGVTLPLEAIAWNHGLLRHKSLPDRMIVPYIGGPP